MALSNLLSRRRPAMIAICRFCLGSVKNFRTTRLLSTATEINKTEQDKASTKTEEESADPKVWAEEKEKLTKDLKSIKDKYLLALADTENVRMRMNKQISDAKLFSIQGFCRDLFEVADILTKATESVPSEELSKNEHLKNLFEGLTMTESQLQKVFNKHGVEKIVPSVGDKFDPYLHEAMFEVPTDSNESGTVAVLTKFGYKLHQRTVRPAVVGVFKGV